MEQKPNSLVSLAECAAVEVHAAGPVSIHITTQVEENFYRGLYIMQKAVKQLGKKSQQNSMAT